MHDIPKRLHLVWVGGPPPRWIQRNWALWDDAALSEGFTVFQWTDSTVKKLKSYRKLAEMELLKDPRVVPDLIRISAVLEFGGIYVDSDTVPIRGLDSYQGDTWPAWIGAQDKDSSKKILLNAVFGMPADHEFLQLVAQEAIRQIQRGVTNPHHIAGPMTWHRVHLEMDPSKAPAILPGFNILHDRKPVKMMRTGNYDMEYLRSRLPGIPVAHIGASHGHWSKEEMEANA